MRLSFIGIALGLLCLACGGGKSGSNDGGSGGGGGGGGSGGGSGGGGGSSASFKTYPLGPRPLYDLAIDNAGNIWAASEIDQGAGNASVFRLTPSTGETKTFNAAGGSNASGTQTSLSVDASGNVWFTTYPAIQGGGVTDPGRALVEFSPAGAIIRRIVNTGPANPNPCPNSPCAQNPFFSPNRVVIDSSGNVWVRDRSSPTYFTQFSPSGTFGTTIAISGSSAPYIDQVVFDGSGNIWAVDPLNGVVVKVSSAGSALGSFTLPSNVKRAQLRLAFDKAGNLWISIGSTGSFSGTGGLLKLSPSGQLLGDFRLSTPEATADGIAVDGAGNIWVVDNWNSACTTGCLIGNSSLYVFDTSGAIVKRFPAAPGHASGGHGSNIAIDASGNVWIASSAQGGGSGLLVQAEQLAVGPQYFPYSGPQFP